MKIRRLTPTSRKKLQKPWGILIRGSPEQILEEFRKMVKEEKPSKIISVGDKVSQFLAAHGFPVHMFIVDGKVMRKPVVLSVLSADEVLRVENPAGVITEQAFNTVMRAASRNRRIKIFVEGEEDLLAVPAALGAPEGAFLVYGQPGEGMVVVKVTAELKRLAREIYEEMEEVSKS